MDRETLTGRLVLACACMHEHAIVRARGWVGGGWGERERTRTRTRESERPSEQASERVSERASEREREGDRQRLNLFLNGENISRD